MSECLKFMFAEIKTDCFVNLSKPKNQLALHIISSKPTGAAVVPVQLILKSAPKEIRLQKDGDGNIPLLYAVEVGKMQCKYK